MPVPPFGRCAVIFGSRNHWPPVWAQGRSNRHRSTSTAPAIVNATVPDAFGRTFPNHPIGVPRIGGGGAGHAGGGGAHDAYGPGWFQPPCVICLPRVPRPPSPI